MRPELYELDDVVMKLVGPVIGVGETNEDTTRLANVQRLTQLTERLLDVLASASSDHECHEYSRKAIGQHAKKFLDDVSERFRVEQC